MTGRPVMLRGLLVAWLTMMWLLLWGTFSVANVASGLALSIALVAVVPPLPSFDEPFFVHPIPALSFLGWFAKALVASNLAVAREVLAPRRHTKIRPAVVATPLRTRSARLAAIIANTITLTPGTLTVDARGRPAVLFVHVMSFDEVDATREEVADLERRVVDAFGTEEERRSICGRTPPARGRRRTESGPVAAGDAATESATAPTPATNGRSATDGRSPEEVES